MNLTHVASFLAVIDCGSFRAAAERLGISQPAVSQHVRKLEEDLGVRLVERRAGGCVATRRASDFVRHARTLLEVAARARGSLAGSELVVGASSNVGIYLIQPTFKRFLDEFGVKGRLTIASNHAVAEQLRSGEIDVAAMEWWDPGDEDPAQFRDWLWRNERLVLIVGPAHRWGARKSIRPRALLEEEILGGEPGTGTGRVLREGLGELVDELRVTRSLGSTEAVKEGVKAGLGVSLVLHSAVREELAAGSLHEVRLVGVDLCKPIHLVCRQSLPEAALPQTFCRAAMEGAA